MAKDAKLVSQVRLVSTTAGRRVFADILQEIFGTKGMTAFHRYGRVLGAVVPLEAVRMLADPDSVETDMQERIRNTARALLDEQEAQGLK